MDSKSAFHKRTVHCSGKTFLLGEYAVLAQQPALVAAVGPRFRIRFGYEQIGAWRFDPESPAGLLLGQLSTENVDIPVGEWVDPFGGRGGLGASSAQFLCLFRAACLMEEAKQALKITPDWESALDRYQDLIAPSFQDCAIQPSGADLVAQAMGGVVLFDPKKKSARQVAHSDEVSEILIFSATGVPGRKVTTHEHLKQLESQAEDQKPKWKALGKWVNQAVDAFENRNWVEFGKICTGYADQLQALGLEHEGATIDRQALSRMPGVFGVKGCGAMGADALLVILEPGLSIPARTSVIQVAQSRGLALVCDGLDSVPGVEVTGG